jgi:homoserine dehydrogenase
MKTINIGLFGFGVVGEGIYQVLSQKPGLGCRIEKIVIKHPEKTRNAPSSFFSTNASDILDNPDIDLVVELIDDAEAAFDIVTKAFENGKSVISANKKMIAEHHETLIESARKHDVSFLYEASVCGSIPVIRNLEEYFDNDLINSVTGIVNGSTNFILTQMAKNQLSYDEALALAREKGFAESDPSQDVEGRDAANKLQIIALHAFGKKVCQSDIVVKGITSITAFDQAFAREKNLVIKLLATCKADESGSLSELSVLPAFIPKGHPLRLTDNEFNGVVIGGQLSDEQFLYGKGAGRYPTSSAVLSDISAYRYQYKYEYKKGIHPHDAAVGADEKCFYISYGADIPDFDPRLLGPVLEKYEDASNRYVVVRCSLTKIRSLAGRKDVSVISFAG